jgi:2'-5' RNA ligase
MRLFVALDLPETIQEQLQLISCGLPGARWVQSEQLHLTLRFIGEADGSELQEIRESLAIVRCRTFSLCLQGVGFFPPRQEPHTLWAGVEHSESLLQLHRQIESALKRIGMKPEQRNFAPHITLARLHHTQPSRMGSFLDQHSLLFSPPFPVNTFQLYRSILGSEGSRYHVEEGYPLVVG